ncbi:MAG: L-serine ammonia-lyase, iron-sulfur-dependent, subunit alpha [Clostridiales bacterium]|nr:L-serine ammonia-lyase, iron-sulfur-dependent, subunit alpha [Clostridiales bacterium]
MNETAKKLIEAVKNDLSPSLGVTEPGAIAYAAAAARSALGGSVRSVEVKLNSGVYKNSFTCAVPGADGMGCALAAALGAVCGDPDKKLTAVGNASPEDVAAAKKLVSSGRARAELASVSPDIFIEATVETENGKASALVSGRHDRLTKLTVNGTDAPISRTDDEKKEAPFRVSSVTFDDILDCVENAEGLDFIERAVAMNLELYREGRRRGLMSLTEAREGFARNSGTTARSLSDIITAGAIEARVRGAKAPAMAITGSGSHGILCMLPVYEAAEYYGVGGGELIKKTGRDSRNDCSRALLLSMLITMYIKENSGLLSTACGCVLAGGTGACLGITYLLAKNSIGSGAPCPDREGLKKTLTCALNSMAASVTGMICHGGNTGCSLKAAVGVDMAYSAAEMAVMGMGAEPIHGILGATAEETMQNMGRIALDMLPVEKTILEIMSCKSGQNLL